MVDVWSRRDEVTGAIDEELASDNPKGRLYARCQRLRFAAPTVSHRVVGSTHALRHAIEMTLVAGAWELSSGTHVARSRRAAEQLAARDLLAELEALLADEAGATPAPANVEGVLELREADAFHLSGNNPKGRLFEWCARRKVARPTIEHRALPGGGHEVRLSMATVGLTSSWCRAKRRTDAEQAAAAELVPQLPEVCAAELDPRGVLASLQQRGEIAHRFEVGERGPPSASVFTAVGHARTREGAELVTESFEGTSKKAAIVAAARELVRLLRAPPR